MGLRHSWALAGIRMPRLRSRTRCRGQPELCPGMDAEPAPEPTTAFLRQMTSQLEGAFWTQYSGNIHLQSQELQTDLELFSRFVSSSVSWAILKQLCVYCRIGQMNKHIDVFGSQGSSLRKKKDKNIEWGRGKEKTLWCSNGMRSCDTDSWIKRLHTHTHTHLPAVCCPLRRPESNDTLVAMCTPKAQTLVFKWFPTKRNSLEKRLIPGWGRKRTSWVWNIFLGWKARKFSKNDGTCQKDTGFSLKGLLLAKSRTVLRTKLMTTLADYNALHKIRIHESILMLNMWMNKQANRKIIPVWVIPLFACLFIYLASMDAKTIESKGKRLRT